MNTVYFSAVERRNFGDLMSSEGLFRLNIQVARNLEDIVDHPLRTHSVIAIWAQEPMKGRGLPDILICKDESENDWAAWITTFAAKIRPFSAFMRLLSQSECRQVANGMRMPELGNLTWPIVGLILGEVLAASRMPDRSLETLSATACASTLSFAMFRALAIHSNFSEWPRLVESWQFVRDVTRQRTRAIEGMDVARVCATIIDAGDFHTPNAYLGISGADVLRACHELISLPDQAPLSLSIVPQFSTVERRMHGAREERVVAVTEFVQRVDEIGAIDSDLKSLMLGYLVSRIAPGTVQHASVLRPVTDRYTTALLWYGFCSGFGGTDSSYRRERENSRRLNVDLPASARRVARELLRPEPLVGPPYCDINVRELVALSQTGGDPIEGLVTTTQGTVTIELAPAIWTAINVSARPGVEVSTRLARNNEILAAMGEHIENLRDAYAHLMGNEFISGEEMGQQSLFSRRSRKK